MKKFTLTCLTFAVFCSLGAFSFAGETDTSKDKEVMQQAPPPCDWYRAHEWDLDLWGAYAFSGNTGQHTEVTDELFFFEVDTHSNDRFIGRDGSWAGGADVKYFFSKYWALGVEGLVVDSDVNTGGGGFGTFTLRYPIGCSRFAPYAWAAGGVMDGGGYHEEAHGVISGINVFPFEFSDNHKNNHAEATAQFGGGLEVRITHRIGVMTDFAWNVVSGPDNNFGLWRFGATLSY